MHSLNRRTFRTTSQGAESLDRRSEKINDDTGRGWHEKKRKIDVETTDTKSVLSDLLKLFPVLWKRRCRRLVFWQSRSGLTCPKSARCPSRILEVVLTHFCRRSHPDLEKSSARNHSHLYEQSLVFFWRTYGSRMIDDTKQHCIMFAARSSSSAQATTIPFKIKLQTSI